jgi:hypothetical protein
VATTFVFELAPFHITQQLSQTQLPPMLPSQMPSKVVLSAKSLRTISAVCSRSSFIVLRVVVSAQIALISETFPANVALFWLFQLSSLFSIGPSVLNLAGKYWKPHFRSHGRRFCPPLLRVDREFFVTFLDLGVIISIVTLSPHPNCKPPVTSLFFDG